MSKIVFFCIPAWGHTNPTVEVVRELTGRGHQVLYYSFSMFREKIEEAGAVYRECDGFLPPLEAKEEKKIGKDFGSLIAMTVYTTLAMEAAVQKELADFAPDVVVSDSLCIWGKLLAGKLKLPYICSTTSFAFNERTARMMKPGFWEMFYMLLGIRRNSRQLALLRSHGYDVPNLPSLIGNDAQTDTIVYTSREFQPCSETFPDCYSFVGTSVRQRGTVPFSRKERESSSPVRIYVSLGTVNNRNERFYRSCIDALEDFDARVLMSVGENTDIEALGKLPEGFTAEHRVNQTEVLKETDVFITHCGMNSVSESLYYHVPMVLFPQQSEQRMVAKRTEELGAGIRIKKGTSKEIRQAVTEVLSSPGYGKCARTLGRGLMEAGGAKAAADAVLRAADRR